MHVFVALLAQEMARGYICAGMFKWSYQNVAEDVADFTEIYIYTGR